MSGLLSKRLLRNRCLLPAACGLLLSAYCLAEDKPTGPPATDKENIDKAQAAAREYLTALYKHDLDTVVRLTHPKLIESWGGPLRAKAVLLVPVERIIAEGQEIVDLDFPEDPIFVHSDAHEFVLVPTKLWVINRKANRTESIDYLFGARPSGGSAWTFIEGSRINRANVGKYFRDFPHDVQFPPRHLKRI